MSSGAARAVGRPAVRTGGHRARRSPPTAASKAALNRITNGLGAELYGTGVRANTVEPRAAVLTEGADALVGGRLRPDQIETLEQMVEAVVALCDCPADVTGRSFVSLDLLEAWDLEVRNLDGTPMQT